MTTSKNNPKLQIDLENGYLKLIPKEIKNIIPYLLKKSI
jgi:hypothetical protein